jgi:hypothetical protein
MTPDRAEIFHGPVVARLEALRPFVEALRKLALAAASGMVPLPSAADAVQAAEQVTGVRPSDAELVWRAVLDDLEFHRAQRELMREGDFVTAHIATVHRYMRN